MSALDLLRARFRRIGQPLAEHVFFLTYAVQDPAVPTWAKVKASAALAYFVSPIDAVPDALPGVGWADDFGVLGVAVGSLYTFASADTRRRARQAAAALFGASADGFGAHAEEARA